MARVRFLHTADLHLSRPFGFLPPQIAEERRRDQRRTLARIADMALEQDVNFVLVSGDVFDRHDPDPTDLEAVIEHFGRIAASSKPVFAIPGNHDYYSPTSFWRTLDVEGVHAFLEPDYRWEMLGDLGVVVAGAAFDRAQSDRRAFESLEIPPDIPCILLTHASYESFEGQIERYHPFSLIDLAHVPALYVALGHYHRFNTVTSDGVTACYPGSPEGLGFDETETGDRHIVVGEIAEDGRVTTEPVKVNHRTMRSVEVDCTSLESQGALTDAIRKVCDPNTLIKIYLSGTPPREMVAAIEEIPDRFKESCTYLAIDQSGLSLSPDVAAGDLTIRGRFRQYVLEQIESATDEGRQRLLRRALDLGLAAFEEE